MTENQYNHIVKLRAELSQFVGWAGPGWRKVEVSNMRGFFFIVDPLDYDKANRYKWQMSITQDKNATLLNTDIVPMRSITLGRYITGIHMQRGVNPRAMYINKNPLDARRCNLKVVITEEEKKKVPTKMKGKSMTPCFVRVWSRALTTVF